MRCFNNLEINLFVCKDFLPFCGLSFHLLNGMFCCLKLLTKIRPHLFIFIFIWITLGSGFKKILLQFMSESVLPMFSSKSFIVPGFIFRSLIYFEFIFVYGVREYSNFILLHVAVQFSQPLLIEENALYLLYN